MNSQQIREYLFDAQQMVGDEDAATLSLMLEADARRFERAFFEEEEAKQG